MAGEQQTRALGRPCIVCHHRDRAAIESELTSGEHSIRGIARRWDLAPESVRRHFRAHLDPAIRDAMEAVRGLPALTVVSRLMDVADAARDARLDAEERGDHRTALAAGRNETHTLGYLAERLGVTTLPTDDLAEVLAEAGAMVQVVARIARSRPEVGEAMAQEFDALGQEAIAIQVRRQTDRGRAEIHETRQEIRA